MSNETVNYFDDIMSEEDINDLNKLIRLRKDLMSYIGIDALINLIRTIIDESEGLTFKADARAINVLMIMFCFCFLSIFETKLSDKSLISASCSCVIPCCRLSPWLSTLLFKG